MKPIIYQASVQSRFSDLDPYGHVNFKHYFDYVISTRLIFMENKFGLTLDKLAKSGFAFYATRGEIDFLRPITGIKILDIKSHVSAIKDDVTLVIPFFIEDLEGKKLYSKGTLFFNSINLSTGKSTPLNDELKKLFFE